MSAGLKRGAKRAAGAGSSPPDARAPDPRGGAADDTPQWLVVYGSLMRGLPARATAFAQGEAAGGSTPPDLLDRLGAGAGLRRVGPCRVAGRLFDLGAYPALRPAAEDADVVRGELHAIVDSAVLERLDRFEGYDPGDRAGSDYLRERIELLEPAGVVAWIYFDNHPTAPAARVASGDWRRHLAERDDSAHACAVDEPATGRDATGGATGGGSEGSRRRGKEAARWDS
ncbi:MAG: gamma-glutamylcyclotransferase family protein [Myxococcota bacterium]